MKLLTSIDNIKQMCVEIKTIMNIMMFKVLVVVGLLVESSSGGNLKLTCESTKFIFTVRLLTIFILKYFHS